MADDVTLPGTGAVVATDEVGVRQFQLIKLDGGGNGVSIPLVAHTSIPDNQIPALPFRPVGQDVWNASFSNVGASVLDAQFNAPIVGTGVTYSQASGALAVVAGTSTNAEFLTWSTTAWRGSLRLRFSTVLSQRIANNNMAVLLADLLGSGLSYTINSATSVSVTLTAHGFTSQNVGQFMCLGGITGAAGVPGRYAIASIVDANTINFTVAGWPASGSGTLAMFGHSYVRHLFNGTGATSMAFDAQRRGWATGDTTAAINTTASPGTVVQTDLTGREIFCADALRVSSTTPNFVARASRFENIPDDNLDLRVFLWNFNGTTAPATSTTWTLSFVSVEKFCNFPVFVQGFRGQGAINAPTVLVGGTATVSGTVTVNGTVTSNIGTGSIASGTNSIGDVGVFYRSTITGAASRFHLVSAGTTNAVTIKASGGRLIGGMVANTNAAWRYVKTHNTAGTPTAGTGVNQTIAVPPNSVNNFAFEGGIGYTSGISITTVTGSADADATAVAAGDLIIDLFFA